MAAKRAITPPMHARVNEEAGTLLPAQLLALQLRARGYTLEQIAPLIDQPVGAVSTLLSLALARLGAATELEAIAAATRRGLIV
jgi:DNA-binding NarL/FixJ family response regulator